MKNWISEGRSLDLTAPAGGVVSGKPVKIGAYIVVPSTTAAEGEKFAGAVEGIFEVDAATHASTQAWAECQILYWDDANKRFTVTATDNTKCAVAAVAKASAIATGQVRLHQAI